MALDTFPAVAPDENTSKAVTFNVREDAFGDGYTQRTANGLNTVGVTIPQVWTNLTKAEADTIEAFIVLKGGITAFLYAPAGETTALKFTCKSYSRAPSTTNVVTMSCQFTRCFDLVG